MALRRLFVTEVYEAAIGPRRLADDVANTALSMAADDRAGIRWCLDNGYPGYTSYASLNDLPWRFDCFAKLVKLLDRQVMAFAKAIELDLGGRALVLDSLWVNVLPPGGVHTSHIHPHSVVSGTYYARVPDGASALKFEDPRLGFMMAAPPRKSKAQTDRASFVYFQPSEGSVLLWESWLRHEVPVNEADDERISASFNYRWAEAPAAKGRKTPRA
ncbi:MAG: TIGR02466 family protein [Hyphomicrobiales bacterium]